MPGIMPRRRSKWKPCSRQKQYGFAHTKMRRQGKQGRLNLAAL